MKTLPVIAAAWLVAAAVPAEPVSFDLSAVADKDVVREAKPMAKASIFGDGATATQCFVEEGASDGKTVTRGLPRDRKAASNDPGLGAYQLLPYDKANVIELATSAESKPKRYVIDVPDGKYQKIGILAAAVDGDASFTIEFKYADGTVEMAWWETDDWYDLGPRGNLKKVVREMDRAVARTGALEKANHFNLYEYIVDAERGLSPEKVLDSIAIANTPNRWPEQERRWGAVFAVNGQKTE